VNKPDRLRPLKLKNRRYYGNEVEKTIGSLFRPKRATTESIRYSLLVVKAVGLQEVVKACSFELVFNGDFELFTG
jgi:hypothetical protein